MLKLHAETRRSQNDAVNRYNGLLILIDWLIDWLNEHYDLNFLLNNFSEQIIHHQEDKLKKIIGRKKEI